MCNCKSCGTELNALNMSDIEPGWCNKCVKIKIEMIHPIKEDEEFYNISDERLNEMSRQLWPFPSTGINGYRQNLDQFKPNPIDSRADYIRKSLIDYESHKIAQLIFKHDRDEENLFYETNKQIIQTIESKLPQGVTIEQISEEWRIAHGFNPFDEKN